MSQVASLIARVRAAPAASGPGGGSTVYKGAGVVTVPVGSLVAEGTIAATGVTGGMIALASIGQHSDADENSEELLSVAAIRATAGAGSVSVLLAFSEPTSGPVRINWMAV